MKTRRAPLAVLSYAALVTGACGGSATGVEPVLDRIEVEPASARVTAVGESAHFAAFGAFSDGSRAPLDVTWSSSAASVVHVDGNGVATAISVGAALVEAAYQGITASASFFIDPDTVAPTLGSVFATPQSVDVLRGPVSVLIEAEFRDRGSGVKSALGVFDGPLGAGITGLVTLSRVTEEVRNDSVVVGIFEGFLEIPGTVGAGTWILTGLRAEDRSGNARTWGDAELSRLGYPVIIEARAGGG